MQQNILPYLYTSLGTKTLLEIIKLNHNLQFVKDSLDLDISVEELYDRISIKKEKRSDVIHIITRYPDRQISCDISNVLADYFINNFTKIQNSSSKKTKEYYAKQHKNISDSIRVYELISKEFYSSRNIMSLESEASIVFEQIRILEDKKTSNEVLIKGLQAQLNAINNHIDTTPQKVVISKTLITTTAKLNSLKRELSILQEKYTEKHPKIINLKKEIALYESNTIPNDLETNTTIGNNKLAVSLKIELTKINSKIESSKILEHEYKKQIKRVKKRFFELKKIERDFYTIKQRLSSLRDILKTIKSRELELQLAMETNNSDFRVLEYATPAVHPLKSKIRIIVITTFLGLCVFIFLIQILRDILKFKIYSSFGFTYQLDVPISGIVPHKEDVTKNDFYQKIYFLYEQLFSAKNETNKFFFIITSNTNNCGKSYLIEKIISILKNQKKTCVHIQTVYEEEDAKQKKLINPYLKSAHSLFSNESKDLRLDPQETEFHYLYDEEAMKNIISGRNVKSLIDKIDQDVIFWEIGDLSENVHVIANLAKNCSKIVILAEYGKSNLFSLNQSIQYIQKGNTTEISGILNNVRGRILESIF
jgi:uncharacterized protein involved in exopolysaccharide biosynthesis